MAPPKLTYSWSIGNIIQIAILLIGGGAWYATVDGKITALEKSVTANTQRGDGYEVRLRSVETNYARSDQRLISIEALLGRMDAKLERIVNNPVPR